MDRTFLVIAILFFWAGFVCAISFMESWLKFRGKGVTVAIGLSIGKQVFTALNRMERIFLLLYAILTISIPHREKGVMFLSLLILCLLAIQTFFLLPKLNKRVDLIVEGVRIEKSFLHVLYVSLELVKVFLLIILGILWWGYL